MSLDLGIDVSWIAKNWHRRSGFFAVLLLAVAAIGAISFWAGNPALFGAAALVAAGVLEIIWRFSRALPKTKWGNLGFVICLACDDEKVAAKIRSDFVGTLRQLLKAGSGGHLFQVLEIPQFHAETVVGIDDARKLREDTRGHFLLFGRVRTGKIGGVEQYRIDLNGVISHSPIPVDVGQKFAKEFRELLPKSVIISTDNDLLGFEVTSEWAEMVAKYMIGVAAAFSGDLDYAESLFRELSARTAAAKSALPVFAQLAGRLPTRLVEIHEARAVLAYEQWVDTHDPSLLEAMGKSLAQVDVEKYPRASILNLSAFHAVLTGKGAQEAMKYIDRLPVEKRDALWHLNVGFLMAYDGDLKRALQHYRKAVEQRVDGNVVGKIEDFVYYIATTQKDKYQFYYCLGFFNWKIKDDRTLAVDYFRRFLKLRKGDDFAKEALLAEQWVKEIRALER